MNKSEKAFKDWLNSNQYPYLPIDQSPETFPEALRGISKRPDFFVIVKNFGMIAVDIKENNIKYNDFIIDEKEITKYLEFERTVKIPVWFVFGNYNEEYKSWYWIPLTKALECKERKNKTGTPNPFRAIKSSDCITIQAGIDGLERLLRD